MSLNKALHHLRVYMMKYDKCRNVDLVEVENSLLAELAYHNLSTGYEAASSSTDNVIPLHCIKKKSHKRVPIWPNGVA